MNIDEIENAMNNIEPPKEKKAMSVTWKHVRRNDANNTSINAQDVESLGWIACKSTAIKSFQFVKMFLYEINTVEYNYIAIKYRSGSVYAYKISNGDASRVAYEFLNSASKGRYLASKIKSNWREIKLQDDDLKKSEDDIPF